MPGMSASYRLRHRVRTPKRGTPTLMLLHWFLDTGSPNLLLVISIVLSIAGSVDAYLNAFFIVTIQASNQRSKCWASRTTPGQTQPSLSPWPWSQHRWWCSCGNWFPWVHPRPQATEMDTTLWTCGGGHQMCWTWKQKDIYPIPYMPPSNR